MAADRLLAHVPLWAQRSTSEVNVAKRHSLELSMRLADRKGDLADFMTRFALSKCTDSRAALTFFQILREAERQGGQRYSPEDIGASEECCLAALEKRRRAQVQRLKDESSDEGGWLSDSELSGEEAPSEDPALKVTPELLADLGVEPTREELETDQWYPSHLWDEASHLLPGHHGFNQRATQVLRRAGLCRLPVSQKSSRPLQPHQEIVRHLVHPKSPVQRLLVDHPTGSGKTREMISVLENFFYDQRPKIAIFPKAAVCRNFYTELLRWPNRYRDYFSCLRPQEASMASGGQPWQEMRQEMWDLTRLPEKTVRELNRSVREVLEMKGQSFRGFMRKSFRLQFQAQHPGEPAPLAPLIAISYASAGGSYIAMTRGQPVSAVMKIAWHGARPDSTCDPCSVNVLDNKILLLDEAHHLLHPGRYVKQLEKLRQCLVTAKGSVVAGFTGTLVLDQVEEGQKLLDIIKGGNTPCDEGFLSSFPIRPRQFFAEALPKGVPDAEITAQIQERLVHRIPLLGESLNSYDLKIEKGMDGKRLAAYCNVCSFVSSFHDGVGSSKARILACPEDCCPKLWAVAQAVATSKQKALVMTSRPCGYLVILELLRQLAAKSEPPFQVATMEELSEFNHVTNTTGEVFRVLVANASDCAEGISFLSVRHVHLTEVPLSQGRFVQMCGRAWRMFGHESLPQDQQTVTYHLYIATLPSWMSSPLAAWAFRAQPRRRYKSGHVPEQKAKELLARIEREGISTLEDLQMHFGGLKLEEAKLSDVKCILQEKQERCQTTAMQRAIANVSAKLLVETWDELALRRLTESSRMGLVELRCIAVDAQILRDLAGYHNANHADSVPRRRLRCKTALEGTLLAEQNSKGMTDSACRFAPTEGSGKFRGSKRPRKSLTSKA